MLLRAAGLALSFIINLCALTVATRASAQPADGAKTGAGSVSDDAKAHYRKGVVHYNLDEFRKAVEEFKAAYRLYPDPTFLYNIAQCHWKLNEANEAISFYRKYLRERPDAQNRDQVEKRIEELEALAATQSRARDPGPATPPPVTAAPPPVTPPAPAESAAASPPPAVPPASSVVSPSAQPAPVVGAVSDGSSSSPASPPIYKRWYVWAGVGAIVLAGVVTAVALSGGGGEPTYYRGDLEPRITIPTR